MDRVHDQGALHRNEAAQPRIAALEFLHHQAVGHVGHARAAVAGKIRAEKSQLRQLRHQVHRKRRFAIVLFDDGQDLLVDELPRRLPRETFLIVQQRIEFQEVDAGECGHEFSFNIAALTALTRPDSSRALPRRVRRLRAEDHWCWLGVGASDSAPSASMAVLL